MGRKILLNENEFNCDVSVSAEIVTLMGETQGNETIPSSGVNLAVSRRR